ncbi:MAG: amidohydrolase [Chloroflexi bacterium]|nr:amidohydrolase [Chloroflexota bacterium]MBI4338777.1 amidohydrolase [Chloroflexota bacterium]
MIIVDTHCHAGTNWFEPVEMLLYQMNRNDVDKAVLIQYWGNHHNQYFLECMQRFPGRFAVVVSVDPSAPDAMSTLEQLAEKSGVVGLRLKPDDRSPGNDPLAIWRKAGELGLVISCYTVNVKETGDPEFHRLVAAVPDTTIVLEHVAGIHVGHHHGDPTSVLPPYTGFRAALDLANYPNVYVKFAGLGEYSPRPPRFRPEFSFEEIPPMLEMAYKAFGPRRLMWGSDYPPVGSREGYRNALQGPMDLGVFSSQEDKEWAFGKTALSVWKFGQG